MDSHRRFHDGAARVSSKCSWLLFVRGAGLGEKNAAGEMRQQGELATARGDVLRDIDRGHVFRDCLMTPVSNCGGCGRPWLEGKEGK